MAPGSLWNTSNANSADIVRRHSHATRLYQGPLRNNHYRVLNSVSDAMATGYENVASDNEVKTYCASIQ
jgi:hypothetical protein